jgi:hypothetical protein
METARTRSSCATGINCRNLPRRSHIRSWSTRRLLVT